MDIGNGNGNEDKRTNLLVNQANKQITSKIGSLFIIIKRNYQYSIIILALVSIDLLIICLVVVVVIEVFLHLLNNNLEFTLFFPPSSTITTTTTACFFLRYFPFSIYAHKTKR